MEINSIIGVFLIIFALGALIFLSWWSRRSIERINDIGPATVRQILKRQTRK